MQDKLDLPGGTKQKASADSAFAQQSTPQSKKPAREERQSIWQQPEDSDNDLLNDHMGAELEDDADDP